MEVLSIDILLLIMEQFWSEWDEWPSFVTVPPLRLVCRSWNDLSVPFIFSHIQLNSRRMNTIQINEETRRTKYSCWGHMHFHMTHATIFDDGPRESQSQYRNCVLGLIAKCNKLRYIKYSAQEGHQEWWTSRLPTSVPNPPCEKFRTFDFHILVNLRYLPYLEYSGIPKDQITSIQVSLSKGLPREGLFQPYKYEQSFLVSLRQLQVLHFASFGGLSFVAEYGRLPPVTQLSLTAYPWRHTPDDLPLIWDFSKLESLAFKFVDPNFFKNVLPSQFPSLRRFSCDTYVRFPEDVVNLPSKFIGGLTELEELKLKNFPLFIVTSGICQRGDRMRILRLGKLWGNDRQCPVSYQDLCTLQKSCANLVEMSVCFESLPAWDDFRLWALAKFQNLKTLNINIAAQPPSEAPSLLSLYEAETVGERVWVFKEGVRLRNVSICREIPCRNNMSLHGYRGFLFRFQIKFIADAPWTSKTIESIGQCPCEQTG